MPRPAMQAPVGSCKQLNRTLRSVVDYRGQAVSALNRLQMRAEMPTLAIWGQDDAIIPVDHAYAALEVVIEPKP